MNRTKIITLALIFSLSACIEQIELPIEDVETSIVIDGTFSDVEERQLIKISKSVALNRQVFDPLENAFVSVESDDGQVITFAERNPGIYTAEGKAEREKKYRLKVILSDGREVTSRYQGVPPSFNVDSISIKDTISNYLNESGKRVTVRSIEGTAHASENGVAEDLFLRYDLETVWFVSEVVCSPFVPAKSCYVYDKDLAYDITLLEVEKNPNPIQFETFVFRREIDEAFGLVFSIKLDLLSYNEREYLYWETVKEVFDQSGNVTDILPARLYSDLITDDGSEIFGNFAVVGKSSFVKFIRNADFATHVNPYCGVPGFTPWPRPDACCNCLLIPGASTEKPGYW